ncbi:hypothetical protein PV326_010058 [Microctonus aethiopoides]|nr:hypothetical protein PV326_010058 [Microctonus aethiopoides]
MWGSCFTPHTRNPYLGRGPKESSENIIKEARTFEWKKPPKTNTKKERQSQNVQNKYIQQKHHYTQSTNSSSMKEIELSWIRASSITSRVRDPAEVLRLSLSKHKIRQSCARSKEHQSRFKHRFI